MTQHPRPDDNSPPKDPKPVEPISTARLIKWSRGPHGYSGTTMDDRNPDANHVRMGKRLAEQQQKIEKLSMHVKWAINHYGVVNTDGIFEILRDAITELEQQTLAPSEENERLRKALEKILHKSIYGDDEENDIYEIQGIAQQALTELEED